MEVQLRSPKEIMKLSRLGCFHQSKLSFLRSFLEEFKDWKFSRDLFELNKEGYGRAIYSFSKKNRTYSLVCFANQLEDEERSDRVIATKWDAAFALYDGIPNEQDIDRLKQNVPKQEVGRLSYKELTLSRANRSVRIFNEVIENLSNGRQPDKKTLSKVGYLYRTTAVYGSGKFGLADRFRIKNRSEIKGPFRLEMMLVYLVRQFTFDQINHIAKNKNPKKFVELDKKIAKGLGIGNSTGLGMAPFIVNHPTLLNNWVLARETILKKIREVEDVNINQFTTFLNCLKKSIINVENWNTESDFQKNKIEMLLKDLNKTIEYLDSANINQKFLFNEIYKWAEKQVCDECLEYLVSIFMEPFDEIVNQFKDKMSSDEDKYFTIPTERKTSELRDILEKNYSDILKIDFSQKENNHNFWFISKNKEEPRLGVRFELSGSELEQPLAIARDIKKLYERVIVTNNSLSIAEFLIENDDLRHVVRRAFIIEKFPYSEILDNTIGEHLMPIDMLRFKLSFFGAIKFDPRSDKWLRICMFQGAPLPDQLEHFNDKWVYETLN
ncbi:hypothetical protein N9U19_00230 [Candidatus Pelagibacter sp.]|nr:hypothetical protein [Candidatus Pelagibacter sp.]